MDTRLCARSRGSCEALLLRLTWEYGGGSRSRPDRCADAAVLLALAPPGERDHPHWRLKMLQVRTALSIAALAAMAACADAPPAPTAVTGGDASLNGSGNGLAQRFRHAKVCPSSAAEEARCHAWVRVDDAGAPLATGGPSGY